MKNDWFAYVFLNPLKKIKYRYEDLNLREIETFLCRKVNRGNISSCCNGKLKTYLGYKWYKIKKQNYVE